MRHFTFFVAATMLLPTGPAMAQVSGPEANARIRVHTAQPATDLAPARLVSFQGHLEQTFTDSLWVRLEAMDGPRLTIARDEIRRLEVVTGRKRNVGKGALWGTGIGAVSGVLAVLATDDCSFGGGWWDYCDDEALMILGSAAGGAAWGALIGFFIKSDRWDEIPASSLTPTVALMPMNGFRGTGFAVGLQLRF